MVLSHGQNAPGQVAWCGRCSRPINTGTSGVCGVAFANSLASIMSVIADGDSDGSSGDGGLS